MKNKNGIYVSASKEGDELRQIMRALYQAADPVPTTTPRTEFNAADVSTWPDESVNAWLDALQLEFNRRHQGDAAAFQAREQARTPSEPFSANKGIEPDPSNQFNLEASYRSRMRRKAVDGMVVGAVPTQLEIDDARARASEAARNGDVALSNQLNDQANAMQTAKQNADTGPAQPQPAAAPAPTNLTPSTSAPRLSVTPAPAPGAKAIPSVSPSPAPGVTSMFNSPKNIKRIAELLSLVDKGESIDKILIQIQRESGLAPDVFWNEILSVSRTANRSCPECEDCESCSCPCHVAYDKGLSKGMSGDSAHERGIHDGKRIAASENPFAKKDESEKEEGDEDEGEDEKGDDEGNKKGKKAPPFGKKDSKKDGEKEKDSENEEEEDKKKPQSKKKESSKGEKDDGEEEDEKEHEELDEEMVKDLEEMVEMGEKLLKQEKSEGEPHAKKLMQAINILKDFLAEEKSEHEMGGDMVSLEKTGPDIPPALEGMAVPLPKPGMGGMDVIEMAPPPMVLNAAFGSMIGAFKDVFAASNAASWFAGLSEEDKNELFKAMFQKAMELYSRKPGDREEGNLPVETFNSNTFSTENVPTVNHAAVSSADFKMELADMLRQMISEPNSLSAIKAAKYSPKAQKFISKKMRKMHKEKGDKKKDPKQEIAVALSMAREKGYKVPEKKAELDVKAWDEPAVHLPRPLPGKAEEMVVNPGEVAEAGDYKAYQAGRSLDKRNLGSKIMEAIFNPPLPTLPEAGSAISGTEGEIMEYWDRATAPEGYAHPIVSPEGEGASGPEAISESLGLKMPRRESPLSGATDGPVEQPRDVGRYEAATKKPSKKTEKSKVAASFQLNDRVWRKADFAYGFETVGDEPGRIVEFGNGKAVVDWGHEDGIPTEENPSDLILAEAVDNSGMFVASKQDDAVEPEPVKPLFGSMGGEAAIEMALRETSLHDILARSANENGKDEDSITHIASGRSGKVINRLAGGQLLISVDDMEFTVWPYEVK